VIERRLRDAADDIGHWTEFDYVVINDRFEQALDDLLDIARDRGGRLFANRPEVVHLAGELLTGEPAGKP
jgi:guanylate kinase